MCKSQQREVRIKEKQGNLMSPKEHNHAARDPERMILMRYLIKNSKE
jgi:hypothetical protein